MKKKYKTPYKLPVGYTDGKPDWGSPVKYTNMDIKEYLDDFPQTVYSDKINPEVLVTIKLALGFFKCGMDVDDACKQVHLAKSVFYRWLNACKEHKAYYMAIQDERIAVVEDALFSAAVNGNERAMEFFLSRRGGERWAKKDGTININMTMEEQKNKINNLFGLVLDAETGEVIN